MIFGLSLRRRVTIVGAVVLLFLSVLLVLDTPSAIPNPKHNPTRLPTGGTSVSVEKKPLSLPPEYLIGPSQSPFCADRYGTPYLEHLRDSATEYCAPQSSSALTCFHVTVTDDSRVDTLCIGQGALFDPVSRKFRLGCELRELGSLGSPASVPEYGKFNGYWYNTGPRVVFEDWVDLDGGIRRQAPPQVPNYTILIKREGSQNLWHCLIEIFSMTIALDVLRISRRLNESQPFLTAADAANTQVVFLDDESDGPYFDLWSIFAQKPILRIKDIPKSTSFKNIIVPLAGGSNPLWQGDWVIHSCEDSSVLRTFSRRVLDMYDLGTREARQGDKIIVTFIDRIGNRRLVDQEEHLDLLRSTVAHVEVRSVDFGSMPFDKQLEAVRDTDILVGVHGAGLTHAMFLQPHSAVVEILPPTLNHKGFRNVPSIMGLSYFSAHASEPPLRQQRDWHEEDVFLEQSKFIELLKIAIKTMYNRGQRNYDAV